ncbi:septum site-determining protein MinC [Aminithiophilus ramosus]|uniref:Septum site-determining protein MinC n=2 Tax=Synergistales TaxID=649776 RepID=A0ACD1DTG5_9BACT|nr:septum site-determining protein MinC [Aminithiophilus ramosus]QTX31552.1 septum site-determining protein MinC [Aminithiophilus ramosus]QVL35359.1 septum site-determining protein MinC [Synergistota bacterium]
MSAEESIVLKSNGSGLRLVVAENLGRDTVERELARIAAEGEAMLRGVDVVLDFQGRPIDEALLCTVMKRLVWPSKMRLLSWVTFDGASLDFLRRSGFPVGEPRTPTPKVRAEVPSYLLFRSLRSGQRFEHDGDVVVVGHVKDGAEVIALGNISVWGRLQGLAHAGSGGDDGARVLAAHMEARQVRIGRRVGYMDKGASWWGRPVLVCVDGETVLVEEFAL